MGAPGDARAVSRGVVAVQVLPPLPVASRYAWYGGSLITVANPAAGVTKSRTAWPGSGAAERTVQVAPPSLVAYSRAWPGAVPSGDSRPASTNPCQGSAKSGVASGTRPPDSLTGIHLRPPSVVR